TTDRDREGRRTVELAHESILTAWPLIGSWVDDARSAIRRHRQLAEAAAEWEASGRAEAMLLTGPRLARLSDRTSDDLALSDSESSFLWASEELAARESRAKQRRRRTITAAFGLAAVIAGALAVAAFVSRSNASENAATAQTRALSSAAALATGEDPQLGILLSVQAMLTDPSQEPTIEERLTLRSAMDADRLAATRQLTVPQEYRAMDLSPDGEIMAVRSANSLQLLDTVTWEEIWVFEAANLDGGVAFSPAGDLLAVGSLTAPDAPHVDVFDVAGGNLVATVSFDDAGCVAAVLNQAWSHDGNHLAVQVWQDCAAPSTASVRIVDTLTWTVSHEIPGEWTPQYAENAPRLVLFDASDEPKVVRVLETETYADIGEFEGHTGDISPDGALLASMIGGAAPDLYSVDASLRFDRLGGLDYLPISGATDFFALSPPEGVDAPPLLLVAVGTAGQTTSVWSIESGMTVYELPTGSVNDIAFDHRKQILYTVGQDGFLQVWDLSAGGLAHPEQQTFPFWFDANAMRTNPQSRIGSMFHENQIGLDLYATFDTETGNLLATQVDEIGLTTYAVAPLPGDRFAYVQGDIAVKEEGPIVIADAAGDVTGTLVGCTTHVDDWRFLLERDPVCLSGGTAFVSLEAPETSVEGTELAVALPDGTLHIWDANSLAKTVTEDITSEIGLERMAEFVELPPLAREFATALGSFGPVRQFGAEWVLVEIAPGDGFAVLNRPELDAVAAFGLPVHDWGFETSHDLSFMLLAGEEGLHRVEIGDWEPSLLFESAETIRGLSISPDDARVMIGSTDGLVHIHDANTGELLDQIAEGWVSDGYWLDENRIVVATGVTGTWKILDLDINRVALAAIDQLTRGFTAEECAQFDIDPCPTLDEMRSAVAARS
nr:WD40 repeat domain-containing protein [Acidimicrobiia bacterium]